MIKNYDVFRFNNFDAFAEQIHKLGDLGQPGHEILDVQKDPQQRCVPITARRPIVFGHIRQLVRHEDINQLMMDFLEIHKDLIYSCADADKLKTLARELKIIHVRICDSQPLIEKLLDTSQLIEAQVKHMQKPFLLDASGYKKPLQFGHHRNAVVLVAEEKDIPCPRGRFEEGTFPCSKVRDAMLEGQGNNKVDFSVYAVDVVQAFKDFHMGISPNVNIVQLKELFKLADFASTIQLKKKCEELMFQSLNSLDEAFELVEVDSKTIREKVIFYIATHFQEAKQDERLSSVPTSILKEIVDHKLLQISSENELLLLLKEWALNSTDNDEAQADQLLKDSGLISAVRTVDDWVSESPIRRPRTSNIKPPQIMFVDNNFLRFNIDINHQTVNKEILANLKINEKPVKLQAHKFRFRNTDSFNLYIQSQELLPDLKVFLYDHQLNKTIQGILRLNLHLTRINSYVYALEFPSDYLSKKVEEHRVRKLEGDLEICLEFQPMGKL